MTTKEFQDNGIIKSPKFVDLYFESKKSSRYWDFEYSAEKIFPYDFNVLWSLLLETEHLILWLFGEDGEGFPLPNTFNRGQRIGARGRFNTFVVDCECWSSWERTLVIQRTTYVDEAPYYSLTVRPHERYSSRLKIHVFSSKKSVPRAMSDLISAFQRIIKHQSNPFMEELSSEINAAFQRFRYFCEDRLRFGPIRIANSNNDYGRWFTYFNHKGTINYYPNRSGAKNPEIGEYLKKDERIGFIRPEGVNESLENLKDRFFLTPGEGYVREIRKQSGDMVKKGERILLLSQGVNTDLQMTVLTLENCYTESEKDDYKLKLDKYCVEVGETIGSGEAVAILVNGSGGDHIELKSRYSGVIKETPLKRGDLVHSGVIAVIKVDKAFGHDI